MGSFSVLSSYVNGAAFTEFWKYVTSHAVSKKQPVFPLFFYCCRSSLGWISSSLQAPFCQRNRRQLSPAFLESPAWNRLLQVTGPTAVTQSSAHIPLWPLCFSHWSDSLFWESEQPEWLKILLMGCWRSAYSFCRVMRELTVHSLLIILWLNLSWCWRLQPYILAMCSKAGWWQLKSKSRWLLYPVVVCENCFSGLSPNFTDRILVSPKKLI